MYPVFSDKPNTAINESFAVSLIKTRQKWKMKIVVKKFIIGILSLVVLPLVGCIHSLQHVQKVLMTHPKGEVRYPAQVGNVAGSIVGLPACFVFLPVTIPLAHCLYSFDKSRENAKRLMWLPIYPVFYCQSTGMVLTGGVPYLLFGWWGVDKPVAATKKQLSNK
jgi:hypothetical protein